MENFIKEQIEYHSQKIKVYDKILEYQKRIKNPAKMVKECRDYVENQNLHCTNQISLLIYSLSL